MESQTIERSTLYETRLHKKTSSEFSRNPTKILLKDLTFDEWWHWHFEAFHLPLIL